MRVPHLVVLCMTNPNGGVTDMEKGLSVFKYEKKKIFHQFYYLIIMVCALLLVQTNNNENIIVSLYKHGFSKTECLDFF